jgi:putative ABC transport system ATP-binding protein
MQQDMENASIILQKKIGNLRERLTAAENVALPLVYAGISKKERNERAIAVLQKVKLEDRMHHKPNELRGGQCQRVAIARALINNPSIILADEPTGNLDSKTSHEIMERLGKIQSEGNTVVLVTHEEDISMFAHRVVRLKDGLIETDKINANPSTIISAV